MTRSYPDAVGSDEVTARWRALIPALSSDIHDDLTGRANSKERVAEIRYRYRSDLDRLHAEHVRFGITVLSLWSPDTYEDSPEFVNGDYFALSVGVPSGLAPWSAEVAENVPISLDYALCAHVPGPAQLPRGPLFLEGVPLVVRISHMVQPLTSQPKSSVARVPN
ncbi:MAG TPA: hypothetical protein VG165_13770 [Solirubrobacteraceae bacterium]|nr:hypothetical protein [Solirubrobacteraceae bacterium]